jgi:hypothetical protein
MSEHRHHHHHGCHEPEPQSGGPAWYYGYHHDSGQMKMMNYSDYMSNAQTTVNKMWGMTGTPAAAASPAPYAPPVHGHHEHHHHDCGCHEKEHGCHEHDCHCECCISCADAVEFARCGEIRLIPLTFDNDTRRDRDVKLVLGAFATEDGTDTGWPAALSETEFKLGPCGHKTVLLRVGVECAKPDTTTPTPPTQVPPTTGAPPTATVPPIQRQGGGTVSKCTVAYATLRAEGCSIRPMVIAVAVLPNDCSAHRVGCQCGCCGGN